MRRVLLDQGLAPQAALMLREQGWDAIHVSEIGMERSGDSEILERASAETRTSVTFDRDFHTHLALSRAGKPSVVFIRLSALKAPEQVALIDLVWSQVGAALDEGAAVTVDISAIRVRRLPLR
jgi:predicted nuclease of predicted toxin-antitoxin system